MSLGPPFDQSNRSLHTLLGGGTVLVLILGIAIALLSAAHTTGETISIHLRLKNSGPIRSGTEVRLAGERIGEVVAISRYKPAPMNPDSASRNVAETEAERIDLELRIQNRAKKNVFTRSVFIARTPNFLAPAFLEVGLPADGNLGRVVTNGDNIEAEGPPDLGELLHRVHRSLVTILGEARELSPEWLEAVSAFSAVRKRLEHIAEPGQVERIASRSLLLLLSLSKLSKQLDEAGVTRAPTVASNLSASIAPLSSQATLLSHRLDGLRLRAEDFSFSLSEKRSAWSQTRAHFRASVQAAKRTARDAQYLLNIIERGQGTLGGFRGDPELYDELKELHRILKHQPGKLLFRPRTPKTNVPLVPVCPPSGCATPTSDATLR